MAATTSQGKSFALFIVGLTVGAAGLAYVASGTGKLALVVGLAALAASFAYFLKIKPAEGKVAEASQPAFLKLLGLGAAIAGWLVVLFGLHLAPSVGGRMATTLIGLLISLVGVIGILPAAANKNAIWKS
ncbi:hypothetical protein [Occallatibacter riparius]|uniref:Uncharacterized protein n=1 Tax=Occallatibacter riparius TaxID=1002689 RepID=A0A9J7BVE7_9BACT|nr:hypothetical protein [Occallatibacter riparius]UWZ86851.1 hypothetical protein MOP44_13085 [Occallatibacter riparius]